MKYAAFLVATFAVPALGQEYSCDAWSVPGHQEAGPLSVLVEGDRLTWSNGQTISEADLVHTGRTGHRRVFANGDTLYLANGRSVVDLRRVHMHGAERDSTTTCHPVE